MASTMYQLQHATPCPPNKPPLLHEVESVIILPLASILNLIILKLLFKIHLQNDEVCLLPIFNNDIYKKEILYAIFHSRCLNSAKCYGSRT